MYLGNITDEMHSFGERLIFPNITYNAGHASASKGKISLGFIYTMNAPEGVMKQNNYEAIFRRDANYLKRLNGTSEFSLSMDTCQFDDYSRYEAPMFDETHKAQVKAGQFPVDCQQSFDMGARLALI